MAESRLAVSMKSKSTKLKSECKKLVYKLPLESKCDCGKMLRKFEVKFGTPPKRDESTEHKVLMVVGATGAGKSTLINGMVNYILGVEWKDDFRFKLIVDEGKSQTNSVTSDITAYTIHHMDSSRFPFKLTIIDTPGFGDTSGLKRDKEITQQITEFFSLCDGNGIDHLNGIGFVTQSALPRLTHTQLYIFDSILSIFGNDVANNIFLLVTFCDGQKPPVLEAVKEANIPYTCHFKFNNSALYPVASKTDKNDDNDDDDDEDFDEMFWDMGEKSLKKFFKKFEDKDSVSLILTKDVLANREKLEVTLQGLQRQMDECLGEMEVLRQEEMILKKYEAEITANENFTYEIKVPYIDMIPLDPGIYVTNCLTCNRTCHRRCKLPDNDDKWRCAVMNKTDKQAACCTLCKCSWKMHKNTPQEFVPKERVETRKHEDLKKKFESASEGKKAKDEMIASHALQLDNAQAHLHSLVEEARTCLDILQKIALKPNPLTQVDYIELMIESEKKQKKEGWKERVKFLNTAREQAVMLMTVVNKPENKNFDERIEAMKKEPGWEEAVKKLEQVKQISTAVEEHKSKRRGFFERMSVGIKDIGRGIKTIISG